MSKFNITYDKDGWRLFIDSLKRSLKAVLLHHGSQYASVPVGQSVHLKERYENLALVFNKIKYADHCWTICGDLKVIPCFLVNKVDIESSHVAFVSWRAVIRQVNIGSKKEWPKRQNLEPGTKNVFRNSLFYPKKLLLPLLHIKLDVMKQFVKAIPKYVDWFKYLCKMFPGLSGSWL